MDIVNLIPGIVGACVGVIGWLGVGLFIQRRNVVAQARNAARAVYFELDVNRLSVDLALRFGSFAPLGRSSFDRLLPELATILDVTELRAIVGAYMGHAGYQQMSTEHDLPRVVRETALGGLLAAHERAIGVLRERAFSARDRGALTESPPEPVEVSSAEQRSARGTQ